MVRIVLTLLWKDLRAELRSFETTLAMTLFAIVTLLVFNFATQAAFRISQDEFQLQMGALFDSAQQGESGRDALLAASTSLGRMFQNEKTLSGVLWVAILLAAVLGLNRSSAAEQEDDCLLALLLAPIDRAHLFLGKAISNMVLMVGVEAVIVPVFGMLYQIDLWPFLFPLIGFVLLGTIGLSFAGTLFSYVAAQTRYREILLPLMLFPVTVPVLIGATLGTASLFAGEYDTLRLWTMALVVVDLVLGVLSFLLFEYVVED